MLLIIKQACTLNKGALNIRINDGIERVDEETQSIVDGRQFLKHSYLTKGKMVLDMRALLVGHALRRWSMDGTPNHALDPRTHHSYLNNPQTLHGVESASLAPGFQS